MSARAHADLDRCACRAEGSRRDGQRTNSTGYRALRCRRTRRSLRPCPAGAASRRVPGSRRRNHPGSPAPAARHRTAGCARSARRPDPPAPARGALRCAVRWRARLAHHVPAGSTIANRYTFSTLRLCCPRTIRPPCSEHGRDDRIFSIRGAPGPACMRRGPVSDSTSWIRALRSRSSRRTGDGQIRSGADRATRPDRSAPARVVDSLASTSGSR